MIRIYALDLIRLLWPVVFKKNLWSNDYQYKIESAINNMISDSKVVWIYQNISFIDIEVGDYAKNMLKELKIDFINK
jgi:hypothetical protein